MDGEGSKARALAGRLAGHLARRPANRLAGPALAVAFVAAAAGLRFALGRGHVGLTVFSLFYPPILAAALVGGELSAVIALALSLALSWGLLLKTAGTITPTTLAINIAVFLLTGAFVAAVGARLRTVMRRRRRDFAQLAEREARYRTLFEGVSEGFALIEGIWDESGRLVDYIVIEANPALLRMFGVEASVVGRRQSELVRGPTDPRYLEAHERAFRGESFRFEIQTPRARRWFDIRLSRVGHNQLAQIVVDITDRKAAESQQTELFDELNHRVKNNLSTVSAMLSLQARASASAEVRQDLQRAVDRIQTISEVHTSLYRTSSQDEVDFTAYLQRLCERLSTALVDPARVRIAVTADPATIPLDQAVALGLIVNELVTNAAKYAYPPPAQGIIRVLLSNLGSGLELAVSDDGQGLAPDLATDGLGMRLVRSLVRQCHAELEMSGRPGLTCKVRLNRRPLPSAESSQSRLL